MASPTAENGASAEFKEIPLSSSIPRPPVAKKRNNCKWFLYGVAAALALAFLLAIFGGIVFFTSRSHQHSGDENRNTVNYSPGQIRAAYRLQTSMNLSVDPCDDFYEYVCGNAVAEMETGSSSFDILQKIAEKKMDKLIRSSERSTSSTVEKVKLFYKSCLAEEKYNQLAVEEAREKIKSLGEFPMIDGSNSPNYSWPDHVLKLAKYGQKPTILYVRIDRDERNRTRQIIKFGVGMLADYNIDWNNKTDPMVLSWKKQTKSLIELFTQDANLPPNLQLDKDIDDLLDLYAGWVKLAEENFDASHSKTFFPRDSTPEFIRRHEEETEDTFTNLSNRFWKRIGLDLRKYLMTIAPSFLHDFIADENLVVHGATPKLEDDLIHLIQKTSPNTWRNYYQLKVLKSYRSHFPEKYKGKGNLKWRDCWYQAQKIDYAFGAVYARGQSSQETKKEMLEMIRNLKESFSQIIQEADWLDEETKKNAQIKLEKQLVKIGYHDSVLDDKKLDEMYKDFKIDDNMSYLNMVKEFKRWETKNNWEIVLKPLDRTQFGMSATEADAMFDETENSITFPLAILGDPFFDLDHPKALNYGGIGCTIGHEITHGFDSNGRHFDEDGNKRNWWTNSSNANFERKAKLMIEQYNNFELKKIGMYVNGTLTLGENIADSGGIKESYRAYKKYLERNGREAQLPGLTFTSEQLFYIGWGRSWCSNASPERQKFLLRADHHSPDKARANVVVSNQPEFAKAFNCPAGSPMNPVKKVDVW